MIHVGNCLEVMRAMDANSVDAIVTDPPYHLTTGKKGGTGLASVNLNSPAGRARITAGFMGKAWDGGDVAHRVETWAEALRVAKPGAWLVAFGGTRTYHRLACAIEDAGWELRDSILRGHNREDCPWLLGWLFGSGFPKSKNLDGDWEGWGTALKPAWEPIVLARKPLSEGSVTANVEAFGTGALNIDACRIGTEGGTQRSEQAPFPVNDDGSEDRTQCWARTGHEIVELDKGRWPANLVHDGSDLIVSCFPQSDGQAAAVGPQYGAKDSVNVFGDFGDFGPRDHFAPRGDSGSAARFFYEAKASKDDRNDGCDGLPLREGGIRGSGGAHLTRRDGGDPAPTANNHPTVKPTDLMRWLCRLVTPPGGLVLDPFCGSGSTGRGAIAEGFRFVGIELDPDYARIAEARIKAIQPGLPFGAVA